MTPTQIHQHFADLVDRATIDGYSMIYRKRRWHDRWENFLGVSGVFAAFALVMGILAGCGWVMWEVMSGIATLVSSIFN